MIARDRDFEAWAARARAVTVTAEIERRGIRLRRAGTELIGPCPVCGGTDRFSVHPRRNLWNCRKAGRGGDAIALVQYLDGANFLGACETLAGAPPPRGEGTRASTEELAAREEARRARQAAADTKAQQHRERERARLFDIWSRASRGAPPITAYFAKRGIRLPPAFCARFLHAAPYFHGTDENGRWRTVHRGPAMLLPITDEDGIFRGLHYTWLDLDRPKGKAEIYDPATGELLPSKKVRGSKQGNRILLVPAEGMATRQVAGEGAETVLSVFTAHLAAGRRRADTDYVSAIDLGNLAGDAADRVHHPTLTRADTRGRVQPVRIPGPTPAVGSRAMFVPDAITHLTLLGDGDSDAFFTRAAMARAVQRHATPGRHVAVAWPPEGLDFNDILLGETA